MELGLIYKIKSEKKHYDFLRSHSIWYKYLNRNPSNYKAFLDDYKKFNRTETTMKINNTINSIDLVANILKVLE